MEQILSRPNKEYKGQKQNRSNKKSRTSHKISHKGEYMEQILNKFNQEYKRKMLSRPNKEQKKNNKGSQ